MTKALDEAIRATCWNIVPACAWPDCACEGHPTVVRLALRTATPTIRAEALEEAAQKAEHYEAPIWSAMIAAAIRTLKDTA